MRFFAGVEEVDGDRVQVSWHFRRVHHEDLLDPPAQFPRHWPQPKKQIHESEAGAANQRRASQKTPVSETETRQAPAQKAAEGGAGVSVQLAELLRVRREERVAGDFRSSVQQDGLWSQRMRTAVLRPRLPRARIHAQVEMQLQVSLVLFCHLRHLQRKNAKIYLQINRF